eukprot:XP_017945738.1 PREDICTED: uncharacterized protein LOC101730743 [Xenopus tropicalis]
MPFSFDFPVGETRLKNTVRIEVEEKHRRLKDLRFVVREVLFGVFGLKSGEILCLQDQERKGVYTITFTSLACCENIYAVLIKKDLTEDRLDGLKFFLLYGLEDVSLVVHMFNPHIDTADISTFLLRYCTEVRFSHCLKNELGYWNGKRKFFVKFKRDPEGIGGFMHPPSNFLIGRNRGYLFYSGMPLYCRNCLRFGHTSENCSEARQVRCNKCGRPGHVAALCTFLKTCNMCGKEGHIYKDCPSKAKKEGAEAKLVKSGPGSEQRPTVVAGPAKTVLDDAGESSKPSVCRTPIKAVPVARRGSLGPEKVLAATSGADPSMTALSTQRRSSSVTGQGIAATLVVPVPMASCTLAVGSEHSARKIPGVVGPEQTFAVPSASESVRKGDNTSRRTSVVESEQGPQALPARDPAKTTPDVPCEGDWIEANVRKKEKKERQRQAKLRRASEMEKSVGEGPGGRKPDGGAVAVRSEEIEGRHPAEKRPRSEAFSKRRERSSSSSSDEVPRHWERVPQRAGQLS